MTVLKRAKSLPAETMLVIIAGKKSSMNRFRLSESAIAEINKAWESDRKQVQVSNGKQQVIVCLKDNSAEAHTRKEMLRRSAAQAVTAINEQKIQHITLADADDNTGEILAFAEGMLLSNYQFLRYKVKNPAKDANSLTQVDVFSARLKDQSLDRLKIVMQATFMARDLVNEPVSTLDAVKLAKEFQEMGKDAGFRVEVFGKSKIESLKMGGLLAVNRGSDIPPTFTVMEYKPRNAKNKKPVVLVGKGVVFDTGGYNIKVGAGMETMKCDMGGAAAVGASMWAIAKAKLPVHVIALVPATDNRINGSAYVAGDVLTMYSGLTVEVLNTDAEGRLILADALAYGEQFDPQLVLEFSTLTGAAMAAIGSYGIVAMGTASERVKQKLKTSGENVYERLAEFPFWPEYDELIKSDVAEIKNLGGPYGGAITAGKFLAQFVKSPFMHFDIAGPAFLSAKDHYRPKGGTGVGVRLLFDYFASI
ncbi:MAG TPA: leucyl aminopeptidase [Bacteroidia bacterium]|nr:leucyl aminopeptidase [Bacteroidia bacterium]